MKRLICSLVVVGSILAARAQGLPPESFGGALWGAMLGGILGSDCHHGFSGTGAAIGAGVGFLAGTIAGEARRTSGEPYPAYTTVRVSAGYPAGGSPYSAVTPSKPAAVTPSKPAAVAARQIPDAPRVPDAPTF